MERFLHTLESDDPPTAVYVTALETIVPPLERYGYDLVEQASTRLRFTRSWRPRWVWALLLLPVAGLVLLLVFERTATITVEFADREGGGTMVVAAGTGGADVRRGFAELSV